MKYKVKDLNAPSRWNMRIWDDDKKEWLCQSDEDALTYYGFDITGGEITEFQGLPKWHPDRHLVWEQSTGLKDKNGKEIYEGDILESEEDYEYGDGRVAYVVYFDNERIAFNLKRYGNQFFISESGSEEYESNVSFLGETEDYEKDEILNVDYIKVIGNIHENPELLGGEK